MAASDHLGEQFAVPKGVSRQPIERVMSLPSAEGDADRPTVGHLMSMKRNDIAHDRTGHYDDIRASMASDGQTEPFKVNKAGQFKEGHHRLIIAAELGWTHVDVRRK